MNNIVAGSCAGMASVLMVHPLDTIRTRVQTNSKFKGVVDCATTTIRKEGFRSFYKGMSFPLAAQAVYKSVMFTVYGAAQTVVREAVDLTPTQPLPYSALFMCGAAAGGANSFVVTPVELVRNRLQVQYGAANATYSGPFDVVRKVLKKRGVPGMFRGLAPTLMRDVPGVGMYYTSFECSKQVMSRLFGDGSGKGLPFHQLLACGAIGGIGFWSIALPFDAVKSVVQTQAKNVGVIQVVRSLWKQGGFARFYRGSAVAFGRGIPGAAVTFTTFSVVHEWLTS